MKGLALIVVIILLLEIFAPATGAFLFGRPGELRCARRRLGRDIGVPPGRPNRGPRPNRGACSNCQYVCRCPGDGSEATFNVTARYRRGRCIPRVPVMVNCDRFQWCMKCRTNLPERDYTGCRVSLPGAPRHH